ncbi:RDD family protein [Tenuifilum thalassicum]|uniref:RDD family protein n=2 Tax=Tenuifilum thalassicum TaxID=2590900 RepID=A0A7D4CB98_9BACT|nr:RDD family protein [Tenuifilum thalassicum]
MKYAGFWWRFLAYLIDAIVLWVVNLIVISPLIGLFGLSAASSMSADMTQSEAIGMAGAFFGAAMVTNLALIVIAWLYFAIMESSKFQGTLGKMAIGIIVTDLEGNRISFARATGRYFGKILSSMILLIGYIMAGFTEKKQALHDMLASTLVWKK